MGYFIFYGYIIVVIPISIIFSCEILSIKRSGGNVYLEMSWDTFLKLSYILGLGISPIWIIISFIGASFAGIDGIGPYYYIVFTTISAIVTILLYLTIIIICSYGIEKKEKILRKNNKN